MIIPRAKVGLIYAGLALGCWAAHLPAQVSPEHLVAAHAAQPTDRDVLDDIPCGKARALAARYLSGKIVDDIKPAGLRRSMSVASSDTDLLHNNLDIEIFPDTETITGSNTMTIESRIDGLTEFIFRLRENFTITAVMVNGATLVSSTPVGIYGRLVTLDRPYDTGEVFTLTVEYTGVAVPVGFGSIIFGRQNGVGADIVYTLSEPYYSATWWPSKDGDWGEPGDNGDKATLELAVTAPSEMRTVSNGLLQGIDDLPGERRRYRWASNYPTATYLVCFGSTTYNTWTQTYDYGTGTMPVEFNIYPISDTPEHRAAWELSIDMLEVFGDLFGLYPFIEEKYGIYECEFNGGMEHQTNTAQGSFADWLTAHEAAHQWWGDAVTCATWNDIWLNEGFATYSEALWQENKPGAGGLQALFDWMATRRPFDVAPSVYVEDTTSLSNIFNSNSTYRKGAWVLHQLRHVVGDPTFFEILEAYRNAYEGDAATTDDFAAVCSAVHGQDLTWFFDQWVYGNGAPAYKWGTESVNINGQDYLRLHVEQVQNASFGIFTMPVDIRLATLSESETHTVWNDQQLEHFVLPISWQPLDVALDDLDWILHTANDQVAYIPGPPVLVQTNPLPGEVLESAAMMQVGITFSEDVSAQAQHFSVVGDALGGVPFVLNYTPGNFTATLTFEDPLSVDVYSVTVDDELVSTAAAISLDGELADPEAPDSLPSGEGLPGGAAVFGFTINSVSPDCNTNGVVDSVDIAQGESNDCHGNGVPDECEGGPWYYADVDGSGAVDLDDLTNMLAGLSGRWEEVPVTFSDLDIAPCGGNGDLNLRDLLAMLDTLGGAPPCGDPCP